jgi:predicted DNA-binding protein (MmcQ/YjbR family)
MKLNPIYSIAPAAPLLVRLRRICSRLTEVTETVTFGHPTFQAGGKTFAVFEQYKGEFGLALKVEKELQAVFLKDPRFYMTPYAGKHGWVTLRMESSPVDWKEVAELVRGSHTLLLKPSNKKLKDQQRFSFNKR